MVNKERRANASLSPVTRVLLYSPHVTSSSIIPYDTQHYTRDPHRLQYAPRRSIGQSQTLQRRTRIAATVPEGSRMSSVMTIVSVGPGKYASRMCCAHGTMPTSCSHRVITAALASIRTVVMNTTTASFRMFRLIS